MVRWVLNSSAPPLACQEVDPADWIFCMDWACVKKESECVADYELEAPSITVLGQVPFQPLSAAALEAVRSGILQRPMPGIPLPFPTEREREAYQAFVRNLSIGKGNKGIGKGKVALPRL